jgi:hypothetical protein
MTVPAAALANADPRLFGQHGKCDDDQPSRKRRPLTKREHTGDRKRDPAAYGDSYDESS